MNTRSHRPRVTFHWLAGLLSVLALISTASAQSTGVVTGQVSNAATAAFLEGVVVTAQGTGRYVLTDREGRYEIVLPPGPVTLEMSYTGLDTKRIPVVVSAGGRAVQDIRLEGGVYRLEAVTVSGPREGSASAITKQREAPNVKNVVASDSFGNVADGNAGDFLQQLPGVSAVYVGADVRSVQIRGIDGALNSVTMDGDRVASSQSAGLGRTFEFEQFSLGNIETIEVTKAPTPDMDADSIGGNVNVVSKSAFNRSGPRLFTYSIGGVYRPGFYTRSDSLLREPIPNVGPSLNFGYFDRLGSEKRLGLVLTATYHSQPGGDTAALANYQTSLVEPYYVTNITVPRPAGAPRTRLALGAKADYKWSERTTLSLNTSYNWFHETNDTRAMLLGTSAAVANFRPGYTSTFEEVLANANSSSSVTLTTDDKSGRTLLFSPSVKHRFVGLELDYGASISNSQTYYDYAPDGRHFQSRPKGSVTYILRNIGFTIDRRESLKWPKYVQTAGPDLYDLNNYGTMLLTQSDRTGEDTIRTAKINAKKLFSELKWPSYIKVGGSIREQERELHNNSRRYNFVGADRIQNTGDDKLGQFYDYTNKWTDSNEGYRQPAWANPFAVARHQAVNSGLWAEDTAFATTQRLSAERSITETVSSAYAMGQTRIGPVSLLAGARLERTETEAEGPLQSGTTFVGRLKRKGAYSDVFPGAHLRYAPFQKLVTRLSYSSGIGRPSFDSLIPLDTVNDAARTITTRNASLQPQYSDNYDATVEYYFEPVGTLSASAFQKDLRDFIFTDSSQLLPGGADNGYDGQYEGYRITTSRNGGRARYRGLELSYSQQFTFLPGFWRGFGLYANYTRITTRGDYGGTTVTNQVAGFLPKTGNLAITYLGHGLNIRLNGVWRSEYLVTNSATAASVVYQEPKLQINLKTRYSLTRRTAIFCDIENLNKSPITETWVGSKDRPNQTRIVVAKIVAGIQGQF